MWAILRISAPKLFTDSYLQLRIDSNEVDLARYPWELLHNENGPLLANGNIELTRYITYPEPIPQIRNPSIWRMLYIASRPRDNGMGMLSSNEHTKVLQSLRTSLKAEKLIVDSLSPPTYEELLDKLDTIEYHIIHFDGHGVFARMCENCGAMNYPHVFSCALCNDPIFNIKSRGYLAFENQNKEIDWIDQFELTNAFSANRIQLVITSACDSAQVRGKSIFLGIGPALIRSGIPAAIAMQMPISTLSATSFAKGFYTALAQGKSIPRAVSHGRKRLFRSNDYFIPTLYLRSGNDKVQPFLDQY